MPQLKLTLLTDSVVHQIIDEAMQLLVDPGIRIHNHEALTLLADAGCKVDFEQKIAFIPEILAQACFGKYCVGVLSLRPGWQTGCSLRG